MVGPLRGAGGKTSWATKKKHSILWFEKNLPEPHETQGKLIKQMSCYVQCWSISINRKSLGIIFESENIIFPNLNLTEIFLITYKKSTIMMVYISLHMLQILLINMKPSLSFAIKMISRIFSFLKNVFE